MHRVDKTAPTNAGPLKADPVRATAPTPKRTRLSAEQRRESILAAAVEVFATAGYRAGKVSDVAAKVGVSEPVVFQNFGSKAALFAAVLDRAAEDMRSHLHLLGARPGDEHPGDEHHGAAHHAPAHPGAAHPAHHATAHDGSVLDLLSRLLDPAHIRRFHAPGAPGRLFADAATLTAEPELSEHATRAIQAVAGHLADVIRQGQAVGDLRPDADPDAAAWLLLSVLSAQPFRSAAMPDRDRREDAVTALALSALSPHQPGTAT